MDRLNTIAGCLLVWAVSAQAAKPQPPSQVLADYFSKQLNVLEPADGPDPRAYTPPKHYVCYRTLLPIVIDGKLNEPDWEKTRWSESFAELRSRSGPDQPLYPSRFKLLWNANSLYIAIRIDSDHIWTRAIEGSGAGPDNSFAMYLDPDADNHNYLEILATPLGDAISAVYNKPPKNGGLATPQYLNGCQIEVAIDGSLNNPADKDRSWLVEMAIPFAALSDFAQGVCPPKDKTLWRLNAAYTEHKCVIADNAYQYVYAMPADKKNPMKTVWAWSPQGVPNIHRPETWGYILFTTQPPAKFVLFEGDSTAWARYDLNQLLYKQIAYRKFYGRYTISVKALGLLERPPLYANEPIEITASDDAFKAAVKLSLPDGSKSILTIYDDARIVLTPQ